MSFCSRSNQRLACASLHWPCRVSWNSRATVSKLPAPLAAPAAFSALRTALGSTPERSSARAASRFWGTLTFGAHCTGWVAGADGRAAGLWIAQRSFDKATDPGAFDNLIGGGVPHGQTPFETLLREGWEEAGLAADRMRQARAGRVIRLQRDVAEGLQVEWIHSFDLALPPDLQPRNQDGEVAGFECLPVEQALALAAGDRMTVDASLVTLDFALRHRLLPTTQAEALEARLYALRVGAAGGGVQSN